MNSDTRSAAPQGPVVAHGGSGAHGGDRLADYYRTILPWLDHDLADRGDLAWWRRRIGKLNPHRVLELGCGTGRVTRVLREGSRHVVGLDRVHAVLSRARERLGGVGGVHLVRGDLRAPPVRSDWDLIAAPNDPLIHLRRDRDRGRALESCARLLARDGRLILDLLWWTPEEVERARSPEGLRKVREIPTPDGTLLVEERWSLARDRRTVTAEYRYTPPSAPPVAASFRGVRWTLPELRRRLERAGLEIVRLRGGYDDRPFEPDEAEALLVESRRTGTRRREIRHAGGARLPSRPLRVGIITSWPRDPALGSGTATALRGLASGLERLGHRVVFLAPTGGGRTRLGPRLLFNLGLGIRSHLRSDLGLGSHPGAGTDQRSHHPGDLDRGAHRPAGLDLLVGVDLDGFLVHPRVPYVVTLKGVAADEARHESGAAALGLRVSALLEARNARRAHRVVVPSEYASRVAQAHYGIPADLLVVVPEPVEPPCRRLEAAGRTPERHANPTVLSVARQYPRKRTDLLLRALPALSERVPSVRLRIVGEGPELSKLRRLASSLRVTDRVTFLGRVTERELAEEYARAHCFCLPSEQEAYGIAAVEAMAAGLPVVGARAGATPEVVRDGVAGLLVEPGDSGALAEALATVLSEPALRARMAAAGRRIASRRRPVEHAREFLRKVGPPPPLRR